MDSLSQRFQQQRERLGLSVRELSRTTKIREHYITAIETGRFDVLPAIYMRSFLRTLGAALGIPEHEITSFMSEQFSNEDDSSGRLPSYAEAPPRPSGLSVSTATQRTNDAVRASVNRIRGIRLTWLILGGLCVLFILWFALRGFMPQSLSVAPADTVDVSAALEPTEGDSLILTAIATDTAWVNITMDGTRTQQRVVVPDIEYRWSATKEFTVSIGNAGAVQFFRNGSPLPVFGKTDEAVRRVIIRRDAVLSSSSTFKAPVAPTDNSPKSPTTSSPLPQTPKTTVQAPQKTVTKTAPTRAPTQQRVQAKPLQRQPQKSTAKSKKPVKTSREAEQPLILPAPPQPIRR